MRHTFTSLLALASMAAAAPAKAIARQGGAFDLLVGGPSQILTARFENNAFQIINKNFTAGSAPSWLRYKDSTSTLYAVNENGADLNTFTLKRDDAALNPAYDSSATGSAGVVFLEFNKDQTRMVGAAYGSEMIDIWDTSATGAPKLLKQIKIAGPVGPGQTAHHPHQAIVDPTGAFMVIPDLGGDQLLVLDMQNDKFDITNSVSLAAGSGPRHGSFIRVSDDKTFFVVATELSNLVVLYEAVYGGAEGLAFKYISEQSTYGTSPPANESTAAAGEVLVAANLRDVYVSNRLSGDASDSVAHFVFDAAAPGLTFAASVPTTGILPRSMGFSSDADQTILFVANQGGQNGLIALARAADSGELAAPPLGVLANSDLVPEGSQASENVGPQFVAAL
ncbi:putative carboxy- -muconate cyclase protein [Rosellinia necatrix]|uniref:Putative carboxy--muconate cyclase protein n=1 Tax=Rosellinia necatrix TaxID=77044 RepID=A0A1W2TKU4_ROSNE|nr:putative carboxy- -muconate cyclase protein [Rosellinia necatrix]